MGGRATSASYNVKLDSVKKCPVCGEPLETGLIVAPRGLYWHKKSFFDEEKIISRWHWKRSEPTARSLRCQSCKIVIFGY